MPYRWHDNSRLTLWPHRSLPARGFAAFIGLTAALFAIPLLTQVGHASLWFLLPFLLVPLAAIWFALRKNDRDRDIVEELTFAPDSLTLTHRRGRTAPLIWTGNPYWTRPVIYPTGGKVPNYLTLKGSGREVELGAFLTEDERLVLKADLERALASFR